MRTIVVAAFLFLSTMPGYAQALALARVFQSHMVVQRDLPIRVFGSAEPSAAVEARLGETAGHAIAAADGRFEVVLPALPASSTGSSLRVTSGAQTILLEDVLVGEVWLCSGQSNMEWPLDAFADCQQAITEANCSRIRLLRMHLTGDPKATTFDGRERREPGALGMFDGTWEACTPATARSFSAIAYSFGRELERALDCPIGLIQNAVGGSPAEAWISRAALAADQRTAAMLENWTECPLIHPWCTGDGKAWAEERAKQIETARAQGDPLPPQQHHRFEPTALFEGGIAPLAGLSLRGAIWYQGESNAHDAQLFESLMTKLLADWRQALRAPRLPFLYVQLAAWGQGDTWPDLRAAQARLEVADGATSMVSAIDRGDTADIHPPGKLVIGQRLARAALKRVYERSVVAGSPRFRSLAVHRGEVGEALLLEVSSEGPLATTDGGSPLAFEVAGENGDFAAGTARILEDGRIEVSSDRVERPRRIRYAWAADPKLNLIDSQTLEPLLPFQASTLPAGSR